jgi:hypothetical protein
LVEQMTLNHRVHGSSPCGDTVADYQTFKAPQKGAFFMPERTPGTYRLTQAHNKLRKIP